ncbi:MAG TPA: hypothetical protein VK066_30635 [Chloroflexota bacterium]|nr:hypothetical protein [Chloroflexota bacterium]
MLELTGAVTVTVDGQTARLVAARRHLVIEVDNPRAFLQAASGAAGSPGGRPLDGLRQAGAALACAGLTVRVVSRGSLLLVLGRDARPGFAQALTGSPHVALGSPLGLLRLLGS